MGRLAALDAKVDAQLLAPLRSGLTFLRLGNLDDALVEFVRAQAVDPYAPSSALCLGLLLQRMGRSAEGKRFVDESIHLNPYIVDGLIPEASLEPGLSLFMSRPSRQIWRISLLDKSFLVELPRRPMHFPELFAERASAAVRHISTAALHPIVSWILGGNLLGSPEKYVSAFDVETGNCLWNLSSADSTLCFVTPRFVVLKSDGEAPLFKLVDVEKGRVLRTMSEEYFRLAFLGGHPESSMGTLFAYFHRDLMPLGVAYDRTTIKVTERGLRGLMKKLRNFPWEHGDISLSEKETVPVSIRPGAPCLTVENRWSHAHVSYGHYAAQCGLWASATITCTV